MTASNLLKFNSRFEGIFHLWLQGKIIRCRHKRQIRLQRESQEFMACIAICYELVSCLAYSFTLKMEAIYFSKRRLAFNRPQGCDDLNSYQPMKSGNGSLVAESLIEKSDRLILNQNEPQSVILRDRRGSN
jgi:hypothetical protein